MFSELVGRSRTKSRSQILTIDLGSQYVHCLHLRLSPLNPSQFKSHSPATTTRSNRGFELLSRVRSSKIVMRKPALAFAGTFRSCCRSERRFSRRQADQPRLKHRHLTVLEKAG